MRRWLLGILIGLSSCKRTEPPPVPPTTVAAPDGHSLRDELLEMAGTDQVARTAWIEDVDDAAARARVHDLDRAHTARMKEIVAQHGWPGYRLAGRDGANAAWLLIQHADADREFQKLCLAKLEAAVAAGDADASDHAYLHDRVAVAEGRPQRFGTQFGDGEPLPIEDDANVDARRAAIGLPSMADYRAQMKQTYGAK